MNIEKIRNLTDTELTHQQRELADQLFKLKFQLNMGQTESLKKIREMRKDIARINDCGPREAAGRRQRRGPGQAGGGGSQAGEIESKEAGSGEESGQEEDGCNGEEVSHGRDDRN